MLTTKMNPRVFWGASLVIGLLLLLAVVAPGFSDRIFKTAQAWVIDTFSWFYVASVAGFLGLVLFLALGPTGALKLGPDDSEPDFPYVSWLAMLFAAGMGIGLMYFGVAEPIQHYISPPEVAPRTFEAAREARLVDPELADRLGRIPLDLLFPAVVSGTALLVAAVLAVWKPWGPVRR